MKYKAYSVVNAGHLRTLEATVNLKLEEGWIPLGNVYSAPMEERVEPIFEITPEGGSLTTKGAERKTSTNWCQAMVLPYEDV